MLARKSTAVRREGQWKDEARRGSLESSRTSLVSFKDNIEIGGRGEGPFALVVRCSTVRRLPRATLGWRGGGAIQCFPKRQNWMSREGKISIIFGPR